jgi:hypothetical protein
MTKDLAFHVECKPLPYPEITMEGTTLANQHTYDFMTESTFSADILGKLATVPLASLTADKNNIKLAIPAKVTFTFPGYEPLTVEPPAWWTSSDMFQAWMPSVTFGPEPPDDGKLQALYRHDGWGDFELIGKGKQLSDIDWLVVQHDNKDGKKKNCGWGLEILLETTVTIYDRRTGAVIDAHPMTNENAPCQDRGIHLEGSNEQRSGIPYEAVKKYVDAQLKAHAHN